MGRRSTHTPQQLRELILDAAQEIIEAHGLAGLSAREIARRIGYSPGTIYNMFDNLDDVVLNVEARVLDALDQRLVGHPAGRGHGRDESADPDRPRLSGLHPGKARAYGTCCSSITCRPGTDLPAWYQQKLEGLMGQVEQALAPHFPPGKEADLQRASRVLWAGVHGITSLSTADKLSVVTTETAGRLIDDLVGTYLAGLARRGRTRTRASRSVLGQVVAARWLRRCGHCVRLTRRRWAMALA